MKKYILIALVAAVTASGCKKLISDDYANPNFPTKVSPYALLPSIENSMIMGHQFDARYLGSYTQNWTLNLSTTNVWDRMGYAVASDVSGEMWRRVYFDLGNNMINMRKWALEAGKPRIAAIEPAIKAWGFLAISDYHGEIVFKDAFQFGDSRFDSQEETYKGIRAYCHQAIAEIDAASTAPADADFATADVSLFGGDLSKWKKLCYGILARTFHHLTNKPNYVSGNLADSAIFYAYKSFDVASEDALYKYLWQNAQSVAATGNFFGEFRSNVASYIQTKFAVDIVNGTNPSMIIAPQGTFVNGSRIPSDPRAWTLFARNVDSNNTAAGFPQFAGIVPLNSTGGISSANNRPRNFWNATSGGFPPTIGVDPDSRYVFKNNAPMPLMTASEMHFIKAEAYLKKGDRNNAHASYKRGIEESFNTLITYYPYSFNGSAVAGRTLTPAIRDAFVALPDVIKTPATLTLSNIMLQKYVALYIWGMAETWVDLRRYHYTDLDAATGAQVYNGFIVPTGALLFGDNLGKLVYRVRPRYNSEYVWNRKNLAAIGGLNADYHTKECWFSQN